MKTTKTTKANTSIATLEAELVTKPVTKPVTKVEDKPEVVSNTPEVIKSSVIEDTATAEAELLRSNPIIIEAQALVEKGEKLSVIKGFLAYKGLNPKEITKAVLVLIPAKVIAPRGDTIRGVLWSMLAERIVDEKEFDSLFDNDWVTNNMSKHKSIFNAERLLCNKIHAKYTKTK